MTAQEWQGIPHGRCDACGSAFSKVMETSQDEDAVRVRIRRCKACGKRWATEEQKIPMQAYFGRSTARVNDKIKRGLRFQPCHYCGRSYRGRGFLRHARRWHPDHLRGY